MNDWTVEHGMTVTFLILMGLMMLCGTPWWACLLALAFTIGLHYWLVFLDPKPETHE